jgi:hypothetical protein
MFCDRRRHAAVMRIEQGVDLAAIAACPSTPFSIDRHASCVAVAQSVHLACSVDGTRHH